jgi:3-isopropylmalate/(R)-2-methylmalate dehydratase small subunit
MEPISEISGPIGLLMRPDIDADTIIPNKFCIRVGREGLGAGLFDAWRREDPDFLLNRMRPTILLTGPNFGCGSSREQAAWAMLDFGIRVVVAPSFGPIFQGNALRNGLIPVVLSQPEIEELARHASLPAAQATVSVGDCSISSGPVRFSFPLPANRRHALLAGLDDVGVTLAREAEVAAFETSDRHERPWAWIGQRSGI